MAPKQISKPKELRSTSTSTMPTNSFHSQALSGKLVCI